MWRTRLIAVALVAVLVVVGFGFVLSSAYLALESLFSATVAALLVGAGLVATAGLVALVAMLIGDRPAVATVTPSAASVSPQPALVDDLQSAEVMAQHLSVLLRNLNPVTIALLGAGVLVGLLRRR